jgi:hypothetical protein
MFLGTMRDDGIGRLPSAHNALPCAAVTSARALAHENEANECKSPGRFGVRGFWFNLNNIPSIVKIIYYLIFYILHNVHFHFFQPSTRFLNVMSALLWGLFSEFEVHHGKNMKKKKSVDEESKVNISTGMLFYLSVSRE